MTLSFRSRVLLAITAITALASICLAIVFLERSRQVIEDNYVRSLWNAMSVSLDTFDESVRQSYDAAVALAADRPLRALLDAAENQPAGSTQTLAVTEHLAGYAKRNAAIEHVYLYLPSSRHILTSIEYRSIQDLPDPASNAWLTAPASASGLSPQLVWDAVDRAPQYMISHVRPLGDLADDAVASVNMEERKIWYQCFDRIDQNAEATLYLLDPTGRIASAASAQDIGIDFGNREPVYQEMAARPSRMTAADTSGNQLLAAVRSPMTGYAIVAVTDRAVMLASLKRQQTQIAFIIALVVLAMFIPAWQMSARMYAPVRKLKDAMQRLAEGDLAARAPVMARDEIGQLSGRFNDMAERIEHLIDDVLEERLKKKAAELEALQYQITPHFMYNTLNSIKFAAILQGADILGEQIGAFVELLQASISRTGAFIPVRDEIRMVQNFEKLQRFRYMGTFEVDFTVDPEAEDCLVPRLILQPIVENAIQHGRGSRNRLCRIEVAARRTESVLMLSVRDDGGGMSEETMQALLSGKTASKGRFSGIGIPNIVQRLQLYYGDKASLSLRREGDGTLAEIRLPASANADASAADGEVAE